MNCGETIVKYVLIIINIVFFLCGIAIITVGSIVTAQNESIAALVSDGIWAISITVIVIGCIVTLVTFFGCCGASKENSCMLYTYATIVGIIFAVEVTGAVLIFYYQDDAKQLLTDQLEESIKQYPNSGTQEAWDYLQQELKCCGANGSSDWATHGIPPSCCKVQNSNCDTSDKSNIFQTGCVDALVEFVESHVNLVGGIAIGVAVVELFIVVFACCIASAAKRR